jgi:uncharacterized membrane protein
MPFTTPNRTRQVTLLAMLTALCVALRIVKIPIPNVQPVTAILMLVTLQLGLAAGLILAVNTMVLSNIFLGFGIWTIPQIGAYAGCILLVGFLARVTPLRRWFWAQLTLCGLLGFLYGFLVSLGMAVFGQLSGLGFWAYYLAGIPFDGYHAAGNLVFYFVLKKPLVLALTKYQKSGQN